jgi:hypothetical protein
LEDDLAEFEESWKDDGVEMTVHRSSNIGNNDLRKTGDEKPGLR